MSTTTQDPEKQLYVNGCPLACVVWHLKNLGLSDATQDRILEQRIDSFPQWKDDLSRGVLDRGGIVKLLELISPTLRNYIHLQSHKDMLPLLERMSDGYVMGFLLHRKPTNHVLAIVSFHDHFLRVMEPTNGEFLDVSYSDCEELHDADYLLFFSSYLSNRPPILKQQSEQVGDGDAEEAS